MTREKIVEILHAILYPEMHSRGKEAAHWIGKAADRILAAIAEEKPKAPASLVEELRECQAKMLDKSKKSEYEDDKQYFKGQYMAFQKIINILSHHEQRTEVVLAEGVFHSADDWEVYFEPKNKPFIRCNCGLTKIDGKRGKLIFVEDK